MRAVRLSQRNQRFDEGKIKGWGREGRAKNVQVGYRDGGFADAALSAGDCDDALDVGEARARGCSARRELENYGQMPAKNWRGCKDLLNGE